MEQLDEKEKKEEKSSEANFIVRVGTNPFKWFIQLLAVFQNEPNLVH